MLSRVCLPAAFGAVLAAAGCSALSGGGLGAGDRSVLEDVLPAGRSGRALAAEAEVTVILAGRSVTLAGAVLLRGTAEFRIDLYDPFDRTVAMIFAEGGSLVQYSPLTSVAAVLRPFGAACPTLDGGSWVSGVLGESAVHEGWRVHSWGGKTSLVRYEAASMAQRIDVQRVEGRWVAKSSAWFCGEEPVMRVELSEYLRAGEGDVPGLFTVRYPRARLVLSVRLVRLLPDHVPRPGLFHPELPRQTRWQAWRLVGEN